MMKTIAMLFAAAGLFSGYYYFSQANELQAKATELEARATGLDAQVQELRAKNEEAARKSDSVQREKADLESKMARLAAEGDRLAKELEGLKSVAAEDTEYMVLKREHIPGRLTDKTPPRESGPFSSGVSTQRRMSASTDGDGASASTGTGSSSAPVRISSSPPVTAIGKDWERVDPVWRIYLRGVQTKRDYPPLAVKESEYRSFIEGSICKRADLNRAKVQ